MKFLRSVLLALLFSLLFGFVLGTWLRLRAERPVRHFVAADSALPRSIVAATPQDLVDAAAAVLEPRQHEEQIGQAIQVA